MEAFLKLVLLFAFARDFVQGAGSCKEASLCCSGRDGSCVVPFPGAASHNALDPDKVQSDQRRSCYCDHACLKVGDCCHDFQEVCGATDCQVSGWGPWSDCSADCGIGAMTRKRHVVRAARNGGEGCPEMLQKRSCYGSQCDVKSHSKANRETAMILPATYSIIRHLNATQDIRNNLRLRYRKDPAEENRKEYCAVFEVTKVKETCDHLGNGVSPLLAKGAEVCVACEMAAMRKHLGYRCQGHGVNHKATRFTFLAFPQCHGSWKRKDVTGNCTCSTEAKANFIFV